ncbi:MAG TPA: arginine repressor [Bacillota bacterium]|nr:arginine repressor [Bacillota bacterium]HOA15863.1 arginine repressor [Bacillota bacterium]HOG52673.1 arginine repressor [Bacillota bacterium]
MKHRRHQKILELIRTHVVETQEQLAQLLEADGIEVTQATVSRDLKELELVKGPASNGRYKYTAPEERNLENLNKRVERVMKDDVVSIHDSENLVFIKTVTGAAHAVAAVLDELNWREVLGTIAGDDSIIMVVKPKEAVEEVTRRLDSLRR